MIVAIHSQIRPNDTQLNALSVKPPLMRSFISIRFNEIRTLSREFTSCTFHCTYAASYLSCFHVNMNSSVFILYKLPVFITI
jgi:hypothetical protein